MNIYELNQLRNLDYSKELFVISDAMRGSERSEKASIIAAAYVLYISSVNPDVKLSSIQDFIQTAHISGNRVYLLNDLFAKNWDMILRLQYAFDPDILKAIILFANQFRGNENDFSTPYGISQIASRLLKIEQNDTVMDLGCGYGSFIRDCYANYPEASYTGLEINTYATEISSIRAEILSDNIYIEQGDILFIHERETRTFDRIFSNYPFISYSIESRQKILDRLPVAGQIRYALMKTSNMDWYFNVILITLMKKNGKAVAIAPARAVFSLSDSEIRKQITERGLLEKVIYLPQRSFSPYTNAQTVMFVFSHNNKSVRMIDASGFYTTNHRGEVVLTSENIDKICEICSEDSEFSKTVNFDEIQERNYNLTPGIYLYSERKIANGVPLKSLIRNITRGAQIKATELDSMLTEEETDTEFLMLKDIHDGIIDQNLPYIKASNKYSRYLVKPNCLLISKSSDPIKISVADINPNRKIIAGGSLYVMELDETKANPYYIKAYLESSSGLAAIQNLSTGSVIRILTLENLQNLTIPMIPIEEQNQFGLEYQAAMDEVRLMRRKTEKAIESMKNMFDTWTGGSGEKFG